MFYVIWSSTCNPFRKFNGCEGAAGLTCLWVECHQSVFQVLLHLVVSVVIVPLKDILVAVYVFT
jgi:hypothetical protein